MRYVWSCWLSSDLLKTERVRLTKSGTNKYQITKLHVVLTYEASRTVSGTVSGNLCCNREMVIGVCREKKYSGDVKYSTVIKCTTQGVEYTPVWTVISFFITFIVPVVSPVIASVVTPIIAPVVVSWRLSRWSTVLKKKNVIAVKKQNKKHFIAPWKVLVYNPNVLIKKHSLCRTTHVDPRCGGVGSFCNGVIYPDPTAIELHSICMLLSLPSTKVKLGNTYQITLITNDL